MQLLGRGSSVVSGQQVWVGREAGSARWLLSEILALRIGGGRLMTELPRQGPGNWGPGCGGMPWRGQRPGGWFKCLIIAGTSFLDVVQAASEVPFTARDFRCLLSAVAPCFLTRTHELRTPAAPISLTWTDCCNSTTVFSSLWESYPVLVVCAEDDPRCCCIDTVIYTPASLLLVLYCLSRSFCLHLGLSIALLLGSIAKRFTLHPRAISSLDYSRDPDLTGNMKWLDGIKAAIPGLLASPGADVASPQTVLEDAPSSVRQVAIIGEQYLSQFMVLLFCSLDMHTYTSSCCD